jgi:hypothetical protein
MVYAPPAAVVAVPIVFAPCVNVTDTPDCPNPFTRTLPETLPASVAHVKFAVAVWLDCTVTSCGVGVQAVFAGGVTDAEYVPGGRFENE